MSKAKEQSALANPEGLQQVQAVNIPENQEIAHDDIPATGFVGPSAFDTDRQQE